MEGQLNIFDSEKQKPCDYAFRRYIGQLVRFSSKHHVMSGRTGRIVEMLPYYTIVSIDGRRYAGTPHDIEEVKNLGGYTCRAL